MRKTLIVLAATLALGACAADHGEAVRVLENAGYSNITPGGTDIWGCPYIYETATFTATGPSGKPVSGSICRSMLSGYAIQVN